ncbi:SusE domain-containing protein [Aquimarina agarilytica]|uniref:SusE domain-containing protein n=1 Tax=Aquimarina agarilytica TaxID=1087449 RepID=UPI000288ACC6|nr:SusE domain-containing protein [Aquimarina agarilytica]
MKNIVRILIVVFLALFVSCERNDEVVFVEDGVKEPTIVTANERIVLNKAFAENTAVTLVWEDAVYDISTPVSYVIELAASGTSFAEPSIVGETSERFYSWSVKEFNDAVINAGLKPDEEAAVDLRVVSSVGVDNGIALTSGVNVYTVVPYPNEAPKLFLVGAFQAYYGKSAWTPTEAIEMNYLGDGSTQVYEAYVKLGNDDGFKFISAAADWSVLDGNYGTDGGAQNGVIVNSGGSSDVKPSAEGFYYVKVDIDNLTYQLIKMDWGIIGSATANGWDRETSMTYDFESNSFAITETLVVGEMKFRSKNTGNEIFGSGEDWKFNVGNSGDEAVAIDTGDDNFMGILPGDYDISLSIDFDGKAVTEITKK